MNYPGYELHFPGYEALALERFYRAEELRRQWGRRKPTRPRGPLVERVRRAFQHHA